MEVEEGTMPSRRRVRVEEDVLEEHDEGEEVCEDEVMNTEAIRGKRENRRGRKRTGTKDDLILSQQEEEEEAMMKKTTRAKQAKETAIRKIVNATATKAQGVRGKEMVTTPYKRTRPATTHKDVSKATKTTGAGTGPSTSTRPETGSKKVSESDEPDIDVKSRWTDAELDIIHVFYRIHFKRFLLGHFYYEFARVNDLPDNERVVSKYPRKFRTRPDPRQHVPVAINLSSEDDSPDNHANIKKGFKQYLRTHYNDDTFKKWLVDPDNMFPDFDPKVRPSIDKICDYKLSNYKGMTCWVQYYIRQEFPGKESEDWPKGTLLAGKHRSECMLWIKGRITDYCVRH